MIYKKRKFIVLSILCILIFASVNNYVARGAQAGTRPRETKAIPAGEVVVVLNEQIFNALVEAMFTLPNPPAFPLARDGGNSSGGGNRSCASEIALAREMSGTRTAVRFEAGRILAPVAFYGSYSAPLVGCLKFEGWAETNLNLSFDQAKQALTARVEVKAVTFSRQALQERADRLRRAHRVETHQANCRATPKHRDHDRVVVDRIHEDVAAVALVKQRVELHLADAPGELAGRGE